MYILKNALKCISRAKGRNILIGIIVLAISISACIGLSIGQAGDTAREEALGGMTITATISFDRTSAMKSMKDSFEDSGIPSEPGENGGGFDRYRFSEMMESTSSMTLDEYLIYAEAESVDDFYYTLTVSLNGSDNLFPVSDEATSSDDSEKVTEDDTTTDSSVPDMPMDMGGGKGDIMMGNMTMGTAADFSVTGYSSDSAMTSFVNQTASITDGCVFDEGTSKLQCIISTELATYNDIEVGDTITFTNPNYEDETYDLTVVGIYTDTSANEGAFSMIGSTSSDLANAVYISYNALISIVEESEANSITLTDEDTEREYESSLSSTLTGTYVFNDIDSYDTFEEEARALGLSEDYTISSADVEAFENSLTNLNTLNDIAGCFLIVILGIGAIVLIVLNLISVRERKYEIGVLTAMGMKKSKVACQFLCEIFTVTFAAVIIGAVIGGVCAVPVTNVLLDSQLVRSESKSEQMNQSFGRDFSGNGMGMGGMDMGDMDVPDMDNVPDDIPDGAGSFLTDFMGGVSDYTDEINSAMNLTVYVPTEFDTIEKAFSGVETAEKGIK